MRPHRPLPSLAVVVLLGATMAFLTQGCGAVAPMAAAIAFAGLALVFYRRSRLRLRDTGRATLCLAAAFFLLSWSNMASALHRHRATQERLTALSRSRTDVLLHGTVATSPHGRLLAGQTARHTFDMTVYAVTVSNATHRIMPTLLPVQRYGTLSLLDVPPSRPLPEVGEGWTLPCRLLVSTNRIPPTVSARIQFPTEARHAPEYNASFLTRLLDRLRRHAADRLATGIAHDRDAVAILHAMMLGLRYDLSSDINDLMSESGIIHIFAISGLHVGILAAFLTYVLPFFRLPNYRWGFLICPLLILYTLMTGAGPSTVRASVMSIIYFSAYPLHRKPDILASLSAAFLALFLYDPLNLVNLSFILSFTVIAGILLIPSALHRIVAALLPPRRDIPVPTGFWRYVLRQIKTYALQLMTTSLAATVVAIPLTAYFFSSFNPVALVANLFAIPLAMLIVLSGSLSLVLGLVVPALGLTFNAAALALVTALVRVTQRLVALPHASRAITPWPLSTVLAYYALLLALLLYAATRKPVSRTA